jgi:large subunit ribosomal protein L6
MSRVGKQLIKVPQGVTIVRNGDDVTVKGPKGTLSERVPSDIDLEVGDEHISLKRRDDKKETRAAHGLARALVANMVQGVTEPFVKELEIQGVGYRADVSGKTLNLLLGFSHPVAIPVPEGLSVSVDRNVIVKIEGINRMQVGQFAADIRSLRPPEPYKGKGIRYLGEQVRRKVGKAGAGA